MRIVEHSPKRDIRLASFGVNLFVSPYMEFSRIDRLVEELNRVDVRRLIENHIIQATKIIDHAIRVEVTE